MSDFTALQAAIAKLLGDTDAFAAIKTGLNQTIAAQIQTIADQIQEITDLKGQLEASNAPTEDPDAAVIAEMTQKLIDADAKLMAS